MPKPREPEFHFRPLRLRDALAVSAWRYPAEYAMYNLTLAPMLVASFLRGPLSALAGVSFYVGSSDTDPLAGVFSLTKRGGDIEIGVGLRPDLNGRGLGLRFLLDGLEVARQRYHPQTFSLYVALFNRRAIAVYERAGFQPGSLRPFMFQGKLYDEMRMTRAVS